jgi:hypothetical protein
VVACTASLPLLDLSLHFVTRPFSRTKEPGSNQNASCDWMFAGVKGGGASTVTSAVVTSGVVTSTSAASGSVATSFVDVSTMVVSLTTSGAPISNRSSGASKLSTSGPASWGCATLIPPHAAAADNKGMKENRSQT